MVLGKLLARVVPGAGKDGKHGPGGKGAAAAFVRDLVQLQEALFPPKDESVPYAPGLVRRIWLAEHKGEAPAPEDVRHFEDLRTQLLGRYPDADALALRWLCDVPGLQAWCDQHVGPPSSFGLGPYFEVVAVLNLWVQRHPAPGAADAVAGTLEEHVRALPPSFHGAPPRGMHHRPVVDAMVGTLARLEAAEGAGALSAPPFARCRRLLDMLLATPPPPGPGPHLAGHTPAQQLLQDVAVAFAPWLAGAGHLQGEYLDRLLLRIPNLPNRAQARDAGWALSPPVPPAWAAAVAAAVDRMLGRVLAGDPDPQVRAVLWCYQGYAGLDHFLAACRALEQHLGGQPIEKQRVRQWWSDSGHPLAWVNRLLATIPPPGPEDTQRAAELAKLAPQTLLIAALYAPAWADLVEPHLDWPALGALARWLKRGAGSEPWRPYQQPAPEDEEGAGPGAVDRAAALEAVARMGEARARELLRHPVARSLYAGAIYYLEAVHGWNAADVEAGFLKRHKPAVRALGMLPDEGDVLQRYTALRRFAKEARQFGAQRQASEQAAAESGLASLAVTAGYVDLAQLEWAMEAQLAQDVDPASRRWTIGDYTVWVEPGPAGPAGPAGAAGGAGGPASGTGRATADVAVARQGKRLKAVPAAVRQAPEYAEVSEAREALADQFDRVRRRLELAMVLGEVLDARSFAPALTTPAGRAMAPRLVLRCWRAYEGGAADSGADPVELLDFRTLQGEPVAAETLARFQVAHPLHLAAAGTLGAWQRRLVAAGLSQPFNQLFREIYTPTAAEREARECTRLAGRRVRLGALAERLKRRGWRADEHGFLRRFAGGVEAWLGFADGASYLSGTEVLTTAAVQFHGRGLDPHWYAGRLGAVDPLHFSEALRDLDLATAAAAPDRTAAPVSREVVAARSALARAFVPAAVLDGDLVRLGSSVAVNLQTGAAYGPDGAAVALPPLPVPPTFPYPDPDSTTAEVVARLIHLSGGGAGVIA